MFATIVQTKTEPKEQIVEPQVNLAAAADPEWPLSPGEMIAARFWVRKLIELQPDSPLNADRQYVLDNWPNVRPIF